MAEYATQLKRIKAKVERATVDAGATSLVRRCQHRPLTLDSFYREKRHFGNLSTLHTRLTRLVTLNLMQLDKYPISLTTSLRWRKKPSTQCTIFVKTMIRGCDAVGI